MKGVMKCNISSELNEDSSGKEQTGKARCIVVKRACDNDSHCHGLQRIIALVFTTEITVGLGTCYVIANRCQIKYVRDVDNIKDFILCYIIMFLCKLKFTISSREAKCKSSDTVDPEKHMPPELNSSDTSSSIVTREDLR